MRVLFILDAAYLPREIGGANVSLHALAKRLRARGVEPIVACRADPVEAAPGAGPEMAAPDYTVLRLADPIEVAPALFEDLAPDAVVARAPGGERLANLSATTGPRLRIYFESGFFRREFISPADAPKLRYGANSPFLARMAEAYLAAPVAMVPPVIEPADYLCTPSGDAILFVNPVAMKGVHLAVAIAERLAHRRFLFARSWPDHPHFRHLEVRLPNVEWVASTHDMRTIFERTKLLLMPSVWEESSGRTLGEAQVSGIPCVASDRGGLRESVGPGGVHLSLADSIADWCEAIERLFTDRAHYAALAAGARAHAARPDYLPEAAVERFLAYIAS